MHRHTRDGNLKYKFTSNKRCLCEHRDVVVFILHCNGHRNLIIIAICSLKRTIKITKLMIYGIIDG